MTEGVDSNEFQSIKLEELQRLAQSLRDKLQTEKRAILAVKAKQYGLTSQKVLWLARQYRKDQIKQTEKGELCHYHQMPYGAFEEATTDKRLVSFNKLKELGRAPLTTGTRPDVVQMTRDVYDRAGNLLRKGVGDNVGAAGAEVTLVFDSSVTELPEYDAIDEYPNLPEVPFDKLTTVLVGANENVSKTQETLSRNGVQAEVKTRAEWVEQHYQKPVLPP